jgi:L,D-transpeptidase ErfK/SrfK
VADDAVVRRHPVGLGRPDWPTFVGAFTIAVKEVDPVWDVPLSIQEELRRAGKTVTTRVAPGLANPLGKYWLGLSVAGYGTHGTNVPASISKFQTHGCIRMLAADIEDLFARVEVGTPGVTIYEPIVIGIVDGALWMEAHPDIYRRDRRDLLGYVTIEAARLKPGGPWNRDVVTRLLKERTGRPERIDGV